MPFYYLLFLFLFKELLAVYEPKSEKTIMSNRSTVESRNGRSDENSFGIKNERKMPNIKNNVPDRAPEKSHCSFVFFIQIKPQRKEHEYKMTKDTAKTIAFGSEDISSTALAKRLSTSERARAIKVLFKDETSIPDVPLRCFFLLLLSDIVFFLSI
jgi:hypothetical protein